MTNDCSIIFDMDGVLIDSEKLWKQAENEVFSSLGVTITKEDTEITKTMTTSEVTKFWYSKYSWRNNESNDVEQVVISRVIELIENENCVIGGVKTFIESLKPNHKIGLATNSPFRIIPVVLDKIGIPHLFDATLSSESEKRAEKYADVYFSIAKKLSVEPFNCVLIEDSLTGKLAAKKAGMAVLAFTNGKKEDEFDIADFSINNFKSN